MKRNGEEVAASLKVRRDLHAEVKEAVRVLQFSPVRFLEKGQRLTVQALVEHAIEEALDELRRGFHGRRAFRKTSKIIGFPEAGRR